MEERLVGRRGLAFQALLSTRRGALGEGRGQGGALAVVIQVLLGPFLVPAGGRGRGRGGEGFMLKKSSLIVFPILGSKSTS